MVDNTAKRDNTPTPLEVTRRLKEQLPPKWQIAVEEIEPRGGPDVVLTLEAPDGRRATLLVEVKSRLDPVMVPRVRDQLEAWRGPYAGRGSQIACLVVTPFLSERTREKLVQNELGYLDLTGNIFLSVEEPGVLIRGEGASRDPDKSSRPTRSLRGVKAGQIVRALVDFRTPLGVRRIAEIAQTDPGNVSRLLSMLERQALVRRNRGGGVEEVKWDELLRTWALDYSLSESNTGYSYLDPRGLTNLLSQLRILDSRITYAVTGSLAAARRAPVAPARLAAIFTPDARSLAEAIGLVFAETGANVLILEPKGPFVFDRVSLDEGIVYVAPSQAAVDLLTGPGRNPAEGEELIDWMRKNEDAWRA